MKTAVFECQDGLQCLVTLWTGDETEDGQMVIQLAKRSDRHGTWGPPIRPVMVNEVQIEDALPYLAKMGS